MDMDSVPGSASGEPPGGPLASHFPRVMAAIVCLLTFLVYLKTLRFQFVHDDRGQILGNSSIRSWQAVPGYFTSHVWAAIAPTFLGNEYRPIFLLWLRINDAVFGERALGWHLTTVLVHVAATYCVLILAYKIVQEWPTAVLSALVFGLHPVHIEGVAWISGVPEPLMAGCLIPAYLCWVRACERSRGGGFWSGASLVLYALALLTKETAVVLLMILFASQWLGFPRPLEPSPLGRVQKFLQILKALFPSFFSFDGCLSACADGGAEGLLAPQRANRLANHCAHMAFLASLLCKTFTLAGWFESVLRVGVRLAPHFTGHRVADASPAPYCFGALEMGVEIAPRSFNDSLAGFPDPSRLKRSGFWQQKLCA
jgi:hypothetical protein